MSHLFSQKIFHYWNNTAGLYSRKMNLSGCNFVRTQQIFLLHSFAFSKVNWVSSWHSQCVIVSFSSSLFDLTWPTKLHVCLLPLSVCTANYFYPNKHKVLTKVFQLIYNRARRDVLFFCPPERHVKSPVSVPIGDTSL